MMRDLPLAEKTNIEDWAFEDLVLKDIDLPTVDLKRLNLTGNYIVIVDGVLISQAGICDLKIDVDSEIKPTAVNNKLIMLNQKKSNSNLKITVPKNVAVKDPLTIVYIAKDRSLVHMSEIILEMGASLNCIEWFIGEGQYNTNIISNFIVGKNANLTTRTMSELYPKTVVYHHKHSKVENDGVIDATNFIINDTNLVFEDFIYLAGRGAEADVKTVSVASGKQKQNITVRTENIAFNTVANIINYGIVKDEAHLAFNGVGKIQKNAKDCDNQQETRILNLSKTAEAVANPFLLIDEGDITAGHAASIGQLDEEQIYYLMSRGNSRALASKMIVSGFLTPFVKILEDVKAQEALSLKIDKKLG